MESWDVIIAGAGIIGVSLAIELRRQGARVLVIDKGEPGNEASSAAAGMLAPNDPETPSALRPLARESARMFPGFVQQIEELSGLQTDFRRQGAIALMERPGEAPADYMPLSENDPRLTAPKLQTGRLQPFFVQEDSIDPRLLMRAAVAAARRLGVEIIGHCRGGETRRREAILEMETEKGVLTANAVVNCCGAWSGVPVRPRKGQMLYVHPRQRGLLQPVLRAPDVYIVPRSSGRILVGATVEDVGFDKTVEKSTINGLIRAASAYLPDLASAEIVESWAGLRPGTPDDLPILGETEIAGSYVASGHFRNGILLAPVTAKVMAEMIAGRPSINAGAFRGSRFSAINI